jgi:hypothetical protein
VSEPEQHLPRRHAPGTPRVPHSFFYDRVVPVIVVGLAIVLLIVLALAIGALVGVIPTR